MHERGVVRNLPVVVALLSSALALSSWTCAFPTGCESGYDAIHVTVRDAQGHPIALGATVTLFDGVWSQVDSSIYDPLTVNGAQERNGHTYDIKVTKRHYNDTWVRRVRVSGSGCSSVTVPVVLTVASGAPAVRSLRLLPPHILLDRAPWNGVGTFTPYLDADVNVSRDVYWRIAGDTASVDFDPITGTLRYRCRARSAYLTITALSMADSSVVALADVAVQGHPATATDPPCQA